MLASAQNSYDLLMLNFGSNEVEIAYPNGEATPRGTARFSTTAQPVAVLPMRLNMHGHAGLVVQQEGKIEPTVMMFAPTATFVVDRTDDTKCGSGSGCTGVANDCSLRGAIISQRDSRSRHDHSAAGTFQLTLAGDDNTVCSATLILTTTLLSRVTERKIPL